MKVLYARVTDSAHSYIATMAARTGLSMSTVTSMVIDEARRRGWVITTAGARITDTEDSPAACSSPAQPPRDQARPRAGNPPVSGAGPSGGTP